MKRWRNMTGVGIEKPNVTGEPQERRNMEKAWLINHFPVDLKNKVKNEANQRGITVPELMEEILKQRYEKTSNN